MKSEAFAAERDAGKNRRSWTSHMTPGAYEMRPCPGVPWTHLEEAALAGFFSDGEVAGFQEAGPQAAGLAAQALQEQFTVRRDSAIQPTMAGYALFGAHPEALRPAWRVTALRLIGTESPVLAVERLDTEGAAPQAIEQVRAFVQRHLGAEQEAGGKRPDGPRLPLAAAMEAVANAVAHRDYAAPSQVFVRLYDDRLEVQNPGGPLPGLTLEQLLAGGESCPRNPIIAGVLRRMGFMAPVGRGLVLIREEMARVGAPAPEFDADAHYFRVTLRARQAGPG
jgi:predicted HTH transcriptional regulator